MVNLGALDHRQFITALGQGGGDGRVGGQALDLKITGLIGPKCIFGVGDLELDLAIRGTAIDDKFILGALIIQDLGCGGSFNRHGPVTCDQQKRAKGNRLAHAEEPVRNQAANQRQQIDQGGIGRILTLSLLVIEQEMLGQIKDQKPAHAVIGEPLPHLGKKQHKQAAGMRAKLQKHRDTGHQDNDDANNLDQVHKVSPPTWRRTDPVAPRVSLSGK